CADMLRRFAAATADSAQWAVWTCVLAPNAVADWKIPLQLAEKAVADDPNNYRALSHHGAVLYRAGHYREALTRLAEAEKAYQPEQEKTSSIAYPWLFLAMTHYRLENTREAQQWLAKAAQWVEQAQQRQKDAATGGLLLWNRRLTVQMLRREAQELLSKKSAQ